MKMLRMAPGERDDFFRIVIRSIFLFEHDLLANASRLSREKSETLLISNGLPFLRLRKPALSCMVFSRLANFCSALECLAVAFRERNDGGWLTLPQSALCGSPAREHLLPKP